MKKEAKVIPGGISVDTRGTVSFCNDFDFKDVKRFYVVSNHEPRSARGWHGHKKEGKYVFVVKGVAAIGCVPLNGKEPQWAVLADKIPRVLYIPPGYANAAVTLVPGTRIMYFSTASLEESQNDDLRFPLDKWPLWSQS